MSVLVDVFALIAALIHIVVGALESFFYDRPAIRAFLTGSTADAPEVRLWRFFVGIYNMFLGLGLVAGVIALHTGHETVGRTLIVYLSVFMVASGIVFLLTTPRLWRGALGQLVAPALALLSMLL